MDVHGRGVEVIFGWPWTRGGGGGSPKLTFFQSFQEKLHFRIKILLKNKKFYTLAQTVGSSILVPVNKV